MTLTVATVNVGFGRRASAWRRTLRETAEAGADVLLVQEAKNVDLRAVAPEGFGVFQDRSSKARAGSAILWRRERVSGVSNRRLRLGTHPRGLKMLTRYVASAVVKVDGVRVEVFSAHFPPGRFSRLYPAMRKRVAGYLANSKADAIVLGADFNRRVSGDHPNLKSAHAKPVVVGRRSIDGFYVSPSVEVEAKRTLPGASSDHAPRLATLRAQPREEELMDFRHIHASLLWKVSRANRRRELDHYRERADLVTTTETSGRRDRKAIFGNVPGWQHYRPGGGAGKRQTTITWRSDVFERDGKPHARLLSKTTWKRVGNGSTTPWIWATVVPLKHKATGKRLYAISCHLPSAVEGTDTPEGYTNSTPRRVRAHRESLGSLQDLVHEIQEGEPEAAILLAGDWNMNLRRERVAEWLSKSLAPLGSCWGGRLPTKGTHHRRVIDATYVWGLATGAQRVLKKRHSDHRAYRTKFSLLDLSPEPEPEPEPAPEPEPDVEALVEEIEDALDAAQASLAHAIERLQEIR